MLLIFFGKSGAGKSYIADIFANEHDFHLYDPEFDITPAMQAAIDHNEPFTDAMRDEYFEIVKKKLKKLTLEKKRVVMPQALFKNKHRRDFKKMFAHARFVWIDASDELIEERVAKRKQGALLEAVRVLNPHFEHPDFECHRLENTEDEEHVLTQVRQLIES